MSASRLLVDWRKEAGLTQGQCAERLGISQPTWSNYEHGLKVPRTVVAVKIATLTNGAVPVEAWGNQETDAA